MKWQHMGPEDALKAFEDLGAKTFVPIHWGSFRLGFDTLTEPIERLEILAKGTENEKKIHVLQNGETLTLDAPGLDDV